MVSLPLCRNWAICRPGWSVVYPTKEPLYVQYRSLPDVNLLLTTVPDGACIPDSAALDQARRGQAPPLSN